MFDLNPTLSVSRYHLILSNVVALYSLKLFRQCVRIWNLDENSKSLLQYGCNLEKYLNNFVGLLCNVYVARALKMRTVWPRNCG